LIAALVIIFTVPKIPSPSGREVGSGVFIILIICLDIWRGYRGRLGSEQRYTAISIGSDFHRRALERQRDGLMFWAGLRGLASSAGPLLILFLIAYPLLIFFVRQIGRIPLPSDISASHVWMAFIAFLILLLGWVFVRAVNQRAARAVQDELDSLRNSKN